MQAEHVAGSLTAAVSHPVTLQVINQGTGIWGNVATGLITGLLTGGITLTGIWLTHRFTLKREKEASEDKLQRDRYFIATQLVFLLENYGEKCVLVAEDFGTEDGDGYTAEQHRMPVIDFSGISGDWRSLPLSLMYRLRELEIIQTGVMNMLSDLYDYDDQPQFDEYFHSRRFHATRLGLKAFILAAKLRKKSGLPAMAGGQWFAPRRLWTLYRRFKKVFSRFRLGPMALSHYINADRSGH